MMLLEVFMVRKRPTYTPEFKVEAVRLAHVGDKSVSQVAQALGVSETTLREWMERAERSKAAVAPAGPLSAEERQELQRLRRENARLQMERDFLKKSPTGGLASLRDPSSPRSRDEVPGHPGGEGQLPRRPHVRVSERVALGLLRLGIAP